MYVMSVSLRVCGKGVAQWRARDESCVLVGL